MSIGANIVEGRQQSSEREFVRFLRYALASTSELEHHLIIARDLGGISQTDYSSALSQLIDVRKMLHGLIARLTKHNSSKPAERALASKPTKRPA